MAFDLHNEYTTRTTDNTQWHTTTGAYYNPSYTPPHYEPNSTQWLVKDEDNPKTERRAGMETLYEVYIVSKDKKVLFTKMIVAENEDDAKLEIDIHSVLRAEKLKMKDVTILCREIGDVKVRKEVQKVKVVDKDEE